MLERDSFLQKDSFKDAETENSWRFPLLEAYSKFSALKREGTIRL